MKIYERSKFGLLIDPIVYIHVITPQYVSVYVFKVNLSKTHLQYLFESQPTEWVVSGVCGNSFPIPIPAGTSRVRSLAPGMGPRPTFGWRVRSGIWNPHWPSL